MPLPLSAAFARPVRERGGSGSYKIATSRLGTRPGVLTHEYPQSRTNIPNLADTNPGVLGSICGHSVFMFGASCDSYINSSAAPGDVVGHRDGAVLVLCGDGGSVWLAQLEGKAAGAFKLPATHVLSGPALAAVPALGPGRVFLSPGTRPSTFQEIWVTVDSGVATVHFEFYNGAMSTPQCGALVTVLEAVRARP